MGKQHRRRLSLITLYPVCYIQLFRVKLFSADSSRPAAPLLSLLGTWRAFRARGGTNLCHR
jgi:hypothetical protein